MINLLLIAGILIVVTTGNDAKKSLAHEKDVSKRLSQFYMMAENEKLSQAELQYRYANLQQCISEGRERLA